jgi:hypothetical protein
LTEIYRCHACSCQEILRTETAGQVSTIVERVKAHGVYVTRGGVMRLGAGNVVSGGEGGNYVVLMDGQIDAIAGCDISSVQLTRLRRIPPRPAGWGRRVLS